MNNIFVYMFDTYYVEVGVKGVAYCGNALTGGQKIKYDFVNRCKMKGIKLMELLAHELLDDICISFKVKENKIAFAFFNPCDGSHCDKIYTFEPIDKIKKKEKK